MDPTGRFPRVSAARPTTADDGGGGGGGWLVRASAVDRGGVNRWRIDVDEKETARGFWKSREENCQATRTRERDLQRIYRERERSFLHKQWQRYHEGSLKKLKD